jgi:hypothetical protein
MTKDLHKKSEYNKLMKIYQIKTPGLDKYFRQSRGLFDKRWWNDFTYLGPYTKFDRIIASVLLISILIAFIFFIFILFTGRL